MDPARYEHYSNAPLPDQVEDMSVGGALHLINRPVFWERCIFVFNRDKKTILYLFQNNEHFNKKFVCYYKNL